VEVVLFQLTLMQYKLQESGSKQIQRQSLNQAMQTGGGPNLSDAYTINGFPEPLYNCSAKCLSCKYLNYGYKKIKRLRADVSLIYVIQMALDRCFQA
jgi:hypothetical protein